MTDLSLVSIEADFQERARRHHDHPGVSLPYRYPRKHHTPKTPEYQALIAAIHNLPKQ